METYIYVILSTHNSEDIISGSYDLKQSEHTTTETEIKTGNVFTTIFSVIRLLYLNE